MIIPVYRVVTTQLPIESTTTGIEAGRVIKVGTTGYAELCGATIDVPFGLAADRVRAAEAFEWVNRVSDFGQESKASGMLSVYHGGGEFYVDVEGSGPITTPGGTAISGVVASGSATVGYGAPLYNGVNGSGVKGFLSTTDTSATVVAYVIETQAPIPSGIPGEFEPASVSADYDWDGLPTGARKFIKIKLVI